MGVERKLAAFAALAVVVGAFAIAWYPFHDHGQWCGPPITSAAHGTTVVASSPSGPMPAVVRAQLQAQLPTERTTYCRRPARVRLTLASGAIAALFVFTIRWRVADPRLRAVRGSTMETLRYPRRSRS
jgi:hypothetical protein